MPTRDLGNEAFDNVYGTEQKSNKWSSFSDIADKNDTDFRLSSEKEFITMRDKLYEKSELKRLEEQLKDSKLSADRKAELEAQAIEERQKLEERAMNATNALMENRYKEQGVSQKAQMLKNEREAINNKKKSLDEQYEYDKVLAAQGDEDAQKRVEEYSGKKLELIRRESDLRKQQSKLEDSQGMKSINQFKANFKKSQDHIGKSFIGGVAGMVSAMGKVSIADIAADVRKEKEDAEAELDDLKNEYDELVEAGASEEELAAKEAEIKAKDKEVALKQALDGVTESLNKFSAGIGQAYNQAFVEAENMLTSYKSHVEARLQGSEKSYKEAMNKISTNLSISPYVKSQEVIEAMREAVDKGIAYNLEQRAFLSQISDKIANTFDAFDSNLLRLIRLQQGDSTAARLGMEAALTKFLNNMFQDTSYLNGNNSQAVAGMLIDASSTMTKEQATAFEFVIQKWMGSLSSVGIDSGTISTLVQAINYLATGDVENLSSNTQMQTLLAMSASKAGLEYSELLLEGLDASKTNKLLASMVEYLKTIAEDSENLVVKSAYGDVFGMNMSDFKAFSNLTNKDIATISSTMMNYGDMNAELQNQFNQLITRTALAEQLKNLYSNAVFGVAQDMVNNPVTYAMTKMLKFMEDSDINMNIPFINAMGFGLDLNANVQDLLRLGLGVGQAFSLVGNIVGGLTSSGGLNLDAWGYEEYTSRGSGIGLNTGTALAQTSSSTYVTTQSSEDMENSALNTAADDAEETKKITNKNNKSEYTFDDFFRATIGAQASSWITSQDMFLKQAWEATDSSRSFISVRDNLSNENFGLVTKGASSDKQLSVYLHSLKAPIPVTLGTAYDQGATADNIAVIKDAIKGIFDDPKLAMRVRAADGGVRIPVDTEIKGLEKDTNTGYRAWSSNDISWN